jgi:hypothetical protein
MPAENLADRQLLPEPGNSFPKDAIPVLVAGNPRMNFRKAISRIFPAGILLLYGLQPFAQHTPSPPGGGGEGHLTVTATVVSSVGLVVGPDGEQRMVVANAADPRDNVSRLQTVTVKMTPVAETPKVKAKKKKAD